MIVVPGITSAQSDVGECVYSALPSDRVRPAIELIDRNLSATRPTTRPILLAVGKFAEWRIVGDIVNISVYIPRSAGPAVAEAQLDDSKILWNIPADPKQGATESPRLPPSSSSIPMHILDLHDQIDDYLPIPTNAQRIAYSLPSAKGSSTLSVKIEASGFSCKYLLSLNVGKGMQPDLRKYKLIGPPQWAENEFRPVAEGLKTYGIDNAKRGPLIADCEKQLLSLTDEELLQQVLAADEYRLHSQTDVNAAVRLGVLLMDDPWAEAERRVYRYKLNGFCVYIVATGDQKQRGIFRADAFDKSGKCLWDCTLQPLHPENVDPDYLDRFVRMFEQ